MSELRSASEIFNFKGDRMVGILNSPALPEGRRVPGVLFLHGFPGAEKNVDIQRALLKQNVASFLLHFRGAWGSEGNYRFTSLVEEARAGLRFLAGQPFVDPARLAVFGFSMGGWAAINLAGLEPRLKALVAVAPVGGPEMAGGDVLQRVKKLSRPLRVGSIPALAKDFVRAVRTQDPAVAAAKRKFPFLLVHGDADDTVPVQVSHRIAAAARAPKKVVFAAGARHDFLDRREWLTRLVAPWLTRHL